MTLPPNSLRPAGREDSPGLARSRRNGVRAVALFEVGKGTVALFAAIGLLWLGHEGVARLIDQLNNHLHLNPASRTPHVFVALAQDLTNAHLQLLSAGVLVYVATRVIEGWGLWHARRWAEWFSVASGAVYVPFELVELARGVTVLKAGMLLANIAIVAYMARVLRAQSPSPRRR